MAAKALTFSEFAKLRGCQPSYVTKLKDQGRLVLTADGKKIKAKESIALIEQTAGNRQDVAERHESTRQESQAEPEAKKSASSEPTTRGAQNKPAKGAEDAEHKETLKEAQRLKLMAESRRVQALADKEEMERDRLAGDLIAREDVDASMKFIGATVRGLLDVFPDQVAPLVGPVTDLNEVHALLGEQCREVLVRLGDAIERQKASLAREGA